MRRFTYLLFSLISILATAQDSEKAIREQFTTYSQLVVDKKIDAALDYTNEDLFKVVPRESMKSLMESIFNMPTMEYRASMPQISEVGPVKNIDGASYAKIKYTANLEMKFLQAPDEEKRTAKETSSAPMTKP
ncbi:MAG: hypothetical protein EOO20_28695 [Chryseobacterium sp.]|nr:MAG: hypothetical protein EOO20_28695 [Chryseobacterium sp.]